MEPVSLVAMALGIAVIRTVLRCAEIGVTGRTQVKRERARRENSVVLLERMPDGYSLYYGPEGEIFLVPPGDAHSTRTKAKLSIRAAEGNARDQ
jgi:hypothetical protein